MPANPEDVDDYLAEGCGRCELGGTADCKARTWGHELALLRQIVLQSGLREEIKWSAPCYTWNGRNILMLSALKDGATVSFFRGAELADPEGVLEKPGENSRFARCLRIEDAEQIAPLEPVILSYVREAIEVEKSGRRSKGAEDTLPPYPDELIRMFESDAALRDAFDALTPGRQRGYLIHFSSAKQSKTRAARIEKCMPKIFDGKGWNER